MARYYLQDLGSHRAHDTEEEFAALQAPPPTNINEKGEVSFGSRPFPKAKATIRWALSLAGRGARGLPVVDASGEGWRELQLAIKVRDRLMHPKTSDDMVVSDDELARDGAAGA